MVSSVSDLGGGAESSLLELARALQDRGHKLFLSVWCSGELASAFEPIGETFVLDAPHDPASPLRGATNRLPALSPLVRLLNWGRLWLRSTREEGTWLEECVRTTGADLIHTNCDLSPVPAHGAAQATGIPRIAHVRDHWRSWFHPRTARALRSADTVIGTSSFLADRFRTAGIEATVIPNPVSGGNLRRPLDRDDREALRKELGAGPGREVFTVAVVGRLDEQKGSLRIVALTRWLMDNARTDDRPVHFLMVGSGSDAFEERVRKAIRDAGAKDRIRLLGHRNDVSRWLPAMDALVVPSSGEPFGRVIVEGMHAGLPVVAFDDGAAPEILEDGVTGELIPKRDISALGSTVQELAWNPDRCRRLGEAAQTAARRFEPPVVAREMEAVYRKLIEG